MGVMDLYSNGVKENPESEYPIRSKWHLQHTSGCQFNSFVRYDFIYLVTDLIAYEKIPLDYSLFFGNNFFNLWTGRKIWENHK